MREVSFSIHICLFFIWLPFSKAATTCVMNSLPNSKYPDSFNSYNFKQEDLEACKQSCLDDAGCVAIDIKTPGFCLQYTATSNTVTTSGSSFHLKECTTAAVTSPDVVTPTVLSTQRVPTAVTSSTVAADNEIQETCTYNQVTGQDNIPVALEVALTLQSCETLCASVAECLAYKFGSGSCSIYDVTTVPSQSDQVGIKTTCEGGSNCCFNPETNSLTSSPAPLITVQANLASCENLCTVVPVCRAVSYQSSCKLYTASDPVPGASGITFSDKTCSGTPATTYTFLETCGGHMIKPCILLPVVLVGILRLLQ